MNTRMNNQYQIHGFVEFTLLYFYLYSFKITFQSTDHLRNNRTSLHDPSKFILDLGLVLQMKFQILENLSIKCGWKISF